MLALANTGTISPLVLLVSIFAASEVIEFKIAAPTTVEVGATFCGAPFNEMHASPISP